MPIFVRHAFCIITNAPYNKRLGARDMGKKPYAIYLFLAFAGLTARAQNIDSMQHVLDTTQNICVKLDMYTKISTNLIQFNQPETRTVTYAEAGKAVDYVLKAIHINAEQLDTLS